METSQTVKQKELVEVIYSVHEKLRKKHRMVERQVKSSDSAKLPESEAWKAEWEAHKEDKQSLEDYALAMYELATEVWDPRIVSATGPGVQSPNQIGSRSSRLKCRLEWVYSKCIEYFGERDNRLKMLDVGSCYNPFSRFSNYFDITALDLHPAPMFREVVHQCDFLEVSVGPRGDDFVVVSSDNEIQRMVSLPESYFDVAVFSFFLEYLPDQSQRRDCCIKAAALLKNGGILFLLRPDSSTPSEGHVRLIKRLKVGLALLGMKRVFCEKLEHVWCSAYVKLGLSEMEEFSKSKRFQNDLRKVSFQAEHELFAIPQDYKQIELECDKQIRVKEDFDVGLADELPSFDVALCD